MTIQQVIWRIGAKPAPLPPSSLLGEAQLENMSVAAPSTLRDPWVLIGWQVDTAYGGPLDLLAVTPDVRHRHDLVGLHQLRRYSGYRDMAPFANPKAGRNSANGINRRGRGSEGVCDR